MTDDEDEARKAYEAIERTLVTLRRELEDASLVTHVLGSAMLVEVAASTDSEPFETRAKCIGYFLCDCDTRDEALALLRAAFDLFVSNSPDARRKRFKVHEGGKS